MDISAIVQRAKEKDPKALEELYTLYYSQMLGICSSIVRNDSETAQDLAHDAFVLIFSSIRQLHDNRRFAEWAGTIARNVALKYLQRKKKLDLVSMEALNGNDEVLSECSRTPDSEMNVKEILRMVERLPDGYGRVFRLAAIEGFSHREIADMLGIEPHSSSSQLSRARRMLMRMLNGKTLGLILLLVIFMPLYLLMPDGKGHDAITVSSIRKRSNERKGLGHARNETEDTVPGPSNGVAVAMKEEHTTDKPASAEETPPGHDEDMAETPRTQTDAAEDSTGGATREERVIAPVPSPREYPAYGRLRGHNRWHLLAMGTVGPGLSGDVRRSIAIDNGANSDWESPAPDFPDSVTTWEDYSRYLHYVEHEGTPSDSLALMQIADHNRGDIVEREVHDRPITFGLALSRSLGKRWGMETGVQYTLLKSRFEKGEGGYSILRKQSIHYVGLPLKLSYNILDYRGLSAYTSAGVTLHIPVHGRQDYSYMVNWQTTHTGSRHIAAPLQWQTGIGFGLQYRCGRNISIFAEPTFSWFIPSGSDVHTVWSEHPLEFTAPMGIRITW